ncbi:hypothetical protein VL06_07020 [Rossellomorea marisflavi]|uniref:DUF2292 domain-containing protein n=1 Tax=Rossellomorea marisflavi TaxID=189381 RepID=A0A0J5SRF7_9BACI|nr:hypothetical protein VL03_01020 [Rossellomorea marisflavi]KML06898.1 hypothetical protein VL06_07020 [Rossellomorea marisflavi]KML35317.1 hypothetical protein VL12_00550 [Rossellomorea marisflavi]KZE45351.1 hypothetical protein AV649_03925 [Rossellomorea marisflavi]
MDPDVENGGKSMNKKDKQENAAGWMDTINSMLENMDFGSITIVVQNGKVIQLERNEKVRIK